MKQIYRGDSKLAILVDRAFTTLICVGITVVAVSTVGLTLYSLFH